MAREYFHAYHSFLESVEPLSDAECGRLFKACLTYSMSGEAPELPGSERVLWPTIKGQIDRDNKKYAEKCKQNRSNILRRYTNVYETIQEPTKSTKEKEKEKEKEREESAGAHTPAEKKPVKHRHGEFGWVRLSDDEYSKLTAEYGEAAAVYYIGVVDSKAEQTGNKNGWKNWNLTVRNAIRGKWTVAGESPPSAHGRPKKRTMKTVTDADGNIHSEWED